jgi:microcystin-dependent protein
MNNTTRRHFFQRLFKSSKTTTTTTPSVPTLSFRSLGDDAYIGEVLLVGFNFTPRGWLPCDGQTLQIAQYSALFFLLGTAYGGNGTTTFALPNLNGRAAVGVGQGSGLTNRSLGVTGGSKTTLLTASQLPSHTVTVNEVTVRGVGGTQGTGLAKGAVAGTAMATVGGTAASFDHTPPYLGLNYIIAVTGAFPQRP